MEETNYRRHSTPFEAVASQNVSSLTDFKSEALFKEIGNASVGTNAEADNSAPLTAVQHKKKTWLAKLKVFDGDSLQYPNRLKGMVLRPLIFLTFPVISYAGFCYGSNLVWFNVLNGTASSILSAAPYHFSSSKVGLAYLSPLLGITLG